MVAVLLQIVGFVMVVRFSGWLVQMIGELVYWAYTRLRRAIVARRRRVPTDVEGRPLTLIDE